MKTPEIYDDKGFLNPYLFLICAAIFVVCTGYISYQGMQASSKAKEINASAQKLEKDTRESSELFKKLETIRKNEIEIVVNENRNDLLKVSIREIAKDLPKYGIESKSKYITE